jgi:hypothetical protein
MRCALVAAIFIINVALSRGWDSDYETHRGTSAVSRLPTVEILHDVIPASWTQRWYTAHVAHTSDLTRFAVVPPAGGCGRLSTPQRSAEAAGDECAVATNGGFFVPIRPTQPANVTHSCLGNAISWGKVLSRSASKVPSLGIVRSSKLIITGYVNSSSIETQKFDNLISGQGWLVRRGEPWIAEALRAEPMDLQTTGTKYKFADIRAPRLAVGHDVQGRLVVVAVDGLEPAAEGVSLYEFSKILKDLGLINAINLDGGGSVSMFVNDTLVNVPSDKCETADRGGVRCPRRVATSLCFLSVDHRKSMTSSGSTSLHRTATPSISHDGATLSRTLSISRTSSLLRPHPAFTTSTDKTILVTAISVSAVVWCGLSILLRCSPRQRQGLVAL